MANEMPKHGTFCWNELMTWDVEAAKKFYKELVGWEPTDSGMPGMNYLLLKKDDKDQGGMMQMPPEIPKEVPSHWMSYITVDDVDAVAANIPKLGGQVMHGPMDIPGVGRFCAAMDPTGAAISFITFPKK
ncbi:MAG: VOC family protein [Candidatus Zixiibacteriota bacterium]